MRWFFLASLFMLFLNAQASKGDVTVIGVVFDNQTKEPLPGASVIYGKVGTSTDENGRFTIKAFSGEVHLIFRFVGYKAHHKTLSLNPNDTVILEIGLDQQVTEIDQIVVSAGRVEQRLSELTVSLSIIEPQALEANHISDASDLLNRTSGVEVIDGQASIRGGSGYSYGAGSRVLTLIDGLPVLSADAGNVKWHFLPLESISQIEIIKGASSVMYGSSALNGVINIRTAEALPLPTTEFYVESGIFGKPQNHDWAWWDTPRFYSSASIGHSQKVGNTQIGYGSFFLFDNGYRKYNDEKLGRLNFRIKHNSIRRPKLSYGLNLNGGLTQKYDFILWEDSKYGALKQSESTAIEFSSIFLTVDPFIALKSKDSYTHELKARIQYTTNDFPEASNNNSDAISVYSEYQTWYAISSFFNVNSGISSLYSSISSPFYGNHTGLNFAGFIQANVNLTQRARLVTGMRLEQNKLDSVSDKVIPLFRAGINYRLMDYTFLRASAGQGYRYPSIAEKHAATTLGAVRIFPNLFLEPETGWNFEVGIKQAIEFQGAKGLVDFALFYSQNKNLIEYVFGIYPDGMGFRATNVEYSRVYGFEVEYGLKWDKSEISYNLNGGYVFTRPVQFDPNTGLDVDIYLKFRRKHSASLNLGASYKDFNVGLTAIARSKILNIDDVFLNPLTRETIMPGFFDYWLKNNKGHLVFDAFCSYSISQHYQLSIVLKNIANHEYMGRPGDIMPHRNISLRFTAKL